MIFGNPDYIGIAKTGYISQRRIINIDYICRFWCDEMFKYAIAEINLMTNTQKNCRQMGRQEKMAPFSSQYERVLNSGRKLMLSESLPVARRHAAAIMRKYFIEDPEKAAEIKRLSPAGKIALERIKERAALSPSGTEGLFSGNSDPETIKTALDAIFYFQDYEGAKPRGILSSKVGRGALEKDIADMWEDSHFERLNCHKKCTGRELGTLAMIAAGGAAMMPELFYANLAPFLPGASSFAKEWHAGNLAAFTPAIKYAGILAGTIGAFDLIRSISSIIRNDPNNEIELFSREARKFARMSRGAELRRGFII